MPKVRKEIPELEKLVNQYLTSNDYNHSSFICYIETVNNVYRNDPLENQVISEFRWVRIKRKRGSILLDNQQGILCGIRGNKKGLYSRSII